MNIKMKLYSIFSIMILIVLIVAGVSSYAARYLNNSYDTLLNGHVENISAIKDLKYFAADETKYMRGYLLTGQQDQLNQLQDAKQSTTKQIAMLEQMLSGNNAQLLGEFKSVQNDYATLTEQLTALKQQGDAATYNQLVATKCVPMAEALADKAEAMEDYERQQLVQERAENAHTVNVVQWTLITVGIVAVLLGIIIATFVVRMFSRPIKLVADSASEIANGNLTIPDIEIHSKDELGQMATAFNSMKNKLRELMNMIASSSEQMAAASEQLYANAEEGISVSSNTAAIVSGMSDSATAQRMQVNENKQRLDQNSSSIADIVAATSQVSQSSERVLSEVEQGNRNVQHTVTQMSVIDQTVQETAASLYKLAEHSQEIAAIIQVIRDIASQTNLLSLNASIEAARAGEHGNGFAVVASEVKKLADYSSQSAGQISTKIEDMIQNMSYTVSKMEEGARQVQSGTAAVQQMGAIFDTVQDTIQIVSVQVKEALQASDVLSRSASSIMDAENHIVGMADMIMDNSRTATDASNQQVSMMQDISAAADSLSQISMELQEEIRKFRV